MVVNLETVSNYTRQHYGPEIKDQTNQSSPLYSRINKQKVTVNGQNLQTQIPLFYGHNEGVGHRGERQPFPLAGERLYQYSTVGQSYLYAAGDVAGQAVAASADPEYAYGAAFDQEIRGLMESIKLELNRVAWGNGSGEIGRFSVAANGGAGVAVAAGAAVTVSSTATLAIGMRVHGFNAVTGGVAVAGLDQATGNRITGVDAENGTITFAEAFTEPAAGANVIMFRYNSRNNASMGIGGIIDGVDEGGAFTTTTLQGIDGSAVGFEWWRANVIGDSTAALAALSLDDVQRLIEIAEIRAQGRPSIILTTYALRRSYLSLLVADRRFYKTLTLDGGFSAVEYTGGSDPLPIVIDRLCPANQMFAVDEKSLEYYISRELDFVPHGNSIFYTQDTDATRFELAQYYQLGCTKRRANSRLIRRV